MQVVEILQHMLKLGVIVVVVFEVLLLLQGLDLSLQMFC
jgi:hypothetical protein